MMKLYQSLPQTNYDWATPSIESLRKLRGANQSLFDQAIAARVELVRLAVFSLIECGVHVSAAAAKFAVAVIQVPVYRLFGGVSPRVALVDAGSHMTRAGKLAAAMPSGLLLGLLRPEWSVNVYQHLSLVRQPINPIASAIARVRSAAATAWKLRTGKVTLVATAAVFAIVGEHFLRENMLLGGYSFLKVLRRVGELAILAAAMRAAYSRFVPEGPVPEEPVYAIPIVEDRQLAIELPPEPPEPVGEDELALWAAVLSRRAAPTTTAACVQRATNRAISLLT